MGQRRNFILTERSHDGTILTTRKVKVNLPNLSQELEMEQMALKKKIKELYK